MLVFPQTRAGCGRLITGVENWTYDLVSNFKPVQSREFSVVLGKMLKLVGLISVFLLAKVKSNASDLELLCPRGWVALGVANYSCSYYSKSLEDFADERDNCAFCLTCRRHSTPTNGFGNVEICLILEPIVALRIDLLRAHLFEFKTGYKVPDTPDLYCSVLLTKHSSKLEVEKSAIKACYQQLLGAEGDTAELICPKSFFLVSSMIRSYYIGTTQHKSLCINCQSYSLTDAVPLRITMCHPSALENSITYYYADSPLEKCQSNLEGGMEIFCGVKLTSLECISCQNGKDLAVSIFEIITAFFEPTL